MKGTHRQRRTAMHSLPAGTSREPRVPHVPAAALGLVVRELVGQLWESEQRHRLAFEQSAVGMAYATLDGRFVAANASWCALMGCSHESVRALSLADLTSGEEHDRHVRLRRELVTGKIASYTLETRQTPSAGAPVWLRFRVSIARAEGDEPLYLLASVQDVTAIKEAEERQTLLQTSFAVERAALEGSLDELRDEARTATQATVAMEQFLATASHELLTPVTIIQTAIQLLSRRVQRRAQSDELAVDLDLLEQAQAQVQSLARVLEDMAQAARVGAGPLELLIARVDLVALVRGVVAAQRLAHPERVIQLNIQLDVPESGTLVVLADADRIAQVVTNYLTNALKYAPPERPVRVEVGRSGGTAEREASRPGDGAGQVARVAVHDEGVGIAPNEQALVWERFHRVPGVRAQTSSGANLGLGLHICKSIVGQHAGTVGLHSVPGAGSTFWFSLPLAPGTVSNSGRSGTHGCSDNTRCVAGVE